MKKIVIALTILCVSAAAFGQGVVFMENPTWEEAVAAAKKQNKLLFVDCYTTWCGPCKGLARNAFPKKEMGDFYNKYFVNVKYDMEKPNGIAFGKLFNGVVKNFPTLLYIRPSDGVILHKLIGSYPVERLVAEARKSMEGIGLAALQAKYDKGERSFDFITSYVNALDDSGKGQEALQVLMQYLKEYDKLDSLFLPKKWAFYGNYLHTLTAPHVQYVISNKGKFDRCSFVNKDLLNKNLERTLSNTLSNAAQLSFDSQKDRYDFKFNSDEYELVRNNTMQLKDLLGREVIFSKITAFDALRKGDWFKLYYTVESIRDFQFRYADNFSILAYGYIMQNTSDTALLGKILSNLRQMQADGEKQFTSFNLYRQIAYVADKLGLKADAAVARQRDAEQREKKEKQFGNTNKRSH